jgi:YegS/Rv2252/BmrU family lipid kinase
MSQLPKKILFVINPISGSGKQKNIGGVIERYLDKFKFSFELVFTTHPKHAEEIILQQQAHFDIIIAVGGDGSVNQIGTSLINSPVVFGIIPAGSGNGLARHLNIPLNFKGAIELINAHQQPIKIDVAKMNGHYFLSTAGTGFDAHVAWKFSTATTRGFLTYAKITLQELFKYKIKKYKLEINDQIIEMNALAVTIANSNQYGNNAYVSPQSKLDDGFLRLIVIKAFPVYYVPLIIFHLFNKSLLKSKFVVQHTLKRIVITSPTEHVQLDGESLTMEQKLNIEIIPHCLHIIGNIQ